MARDRLPKGDVVGRRTYTFNVLAAQDPDSPGVWIAHCLELDVYGEAGNIAGALRSVGEAIDEVVCNDVNRGADPLLRRAPDASWDVLEAIQESTAPIAINLDTWEQPEGIRALAATLRREFLTIRARAPAPKTSPHGRWHSPSAWSSATAP
jgi:hypothetical protein